MSSTIDQKISEFIEAACLIQFGQDAETDTNLMSTGIMDSMGFIELVQYLESEFDLEYSDEELNSKEFSTLDGIQALTQRKLNDAK